MIMASSGSWSLFFGIKGEEENDGDDHRVNQQMNSQHVPAAQPHQHVPSKKRRNQPAGLIPYGGGDGEVEVEVIALSPTSLMATNRFVCEVCQKGFQREQNLQLHRRGHNLPWKLKHKVEGAVVRRKVYLCPEPTCPHHHSSRALGDLTGVKKHFSRKHGEKKFKCYKCSKMYAVHSDWKAHSKTCGAKEYKCDCGTLFSRRDSFITHRAFCDALTQESGVRQPPTFNLGASLFKSNSQSLNLSEQLGSQISPATHFLPDHNMQIGGPSIGYKPSPTFFLPSSDQQTQLEFQQDFDHTKTFKNPMMNGNTPHIYDMSFMGNGGSCYESRGGAAMSHNLCPPLSATALLQKAALLGSTTSIQNSASSNLMRGYAISSSSCGVGGGHFGVSGNNNSNLNELLNSRTDVRGGGSSIFNRYNIYEQEESYGGGDHNDERKVFNFGAPEQVQQHQAPATQIMTNANMGFQGSDALTLTLDFLGQGQGSGINT